MENQIFQLSYALDTFYFLVCGALVMWMAAGFAMLEAGLVRSKNTTEILTKNVSLYAISCTMYMICGYAIMYPDLGSSLLGGITGDGVAGAAEPATYAPSADFFFQVVFVATAMSIVSGAVAERMKLWAFLAFAVVMTGSVKRCLVCIRLATLVFQTLPVRALCTWRVHPQLFQASYC